MRQKRILIVEDNADNRFLLVHRLRKTGTYEVFEAADGLEALALIAQYPPDVMITDLKMPRLDGWELLRRVRAMAETVRTVPILALTAQAMEGDEQRVLAAGCDDYLAKPVIQTQVLMDKIERLLARAAPP